MIFISNKNKANNQEMLIKSTSYTRIRSLFSLYLNKYKLEHRSTEKDKKKIKHIIVAGVYVCV